MLVHRTARWVLPLLLAAACAGADTADDQTAAAADGAADAAAAEPAVQLACVPQREVADRPSPYDSTTVPLGGAQAKICYNRPSARGRTMLGGELPYGTPWRTGANEPTTIHVPVAASIAGIAVEPGSYTIYTIPGEQEWTVMVNRSTSQWGAAPYEGDLAAQEVGRATVPAETTDEHVEQFTIRTEPAGQGADIIMEWETTRVRVPITRA
jgi:Protein of unknown function (DUF2911)